MQSKWLGVLDRIRTQADVRQALIRLKRLGPAIFKRKRRQICKLKKTLLTSALKSVTFQMVVHTHRAGFELEINMTQGFVYILLNPTFPDLVKIGRTQNATEKRAKELRGTGVPTPFIVVYEEIVSDCKEVERRLHERYTGFRVSSDREFFRIPIKDAIKALQDEASNFPQSPIAFRRVEILPALKKKYGDKLRDDFSSIGIVHVPDICYLETVIRKPNKYIHDEVAHRTDLSFVWDHNAPMFPPSGDIELNARRFVEEFDETNVWNIYDLTK